MAQDAENTQDVQDTPPVDDVQDTTPAPAFDDAKVKEILSQKRKANAEAVAAKKERDTLAARIKEIEDKEKSELEKALEDTAQKAAALAALEAQVASQTRVNACLTNGVTPEYAGYVATELAKAQEDPELDIGEWFKGFKKAHVHFFGGNGVAAPGSGEGGPASGSASKQVRLNEIRERIKVLMSRRQSEDGEMELMQLRGEERTLLAATK